MGQSLLRGMFTLVFPGGLLFLGALGFLRPQGLPPWCQGPVAVLPYLALTFGLVFGWYFASARMLLSLACLAVADQALVRWPPRTPAPLRARTPTRTHDTRTRDQRTTHPQSSAEP